MRKLDDRELGTVLAALRHYQRHLETHNCNAPRELEDIASNGGEFEPLDVTEIDGLCEQLNCGGEDLNVPDEHDVLRGHVKGLVAALDTLGFARQDAEVSGAETVNVLNEHLPGLRELIA